MKTVLVDSNSILYVLFHFQILMDDECTSWLDKFCIMTETFQICFFCSIDVQMVWVCCSNYAHPRTQPMETAIEFISFYDYIVALVGKYVVGAVIFRNTAQESVTVYMTLMHDVGAHGRCRGLTMSSCYAQPLMGASQSAQYLCTFFDGKSILMEIHKFLVLCWDGWSKDDQCCFWILASLWYQVCILLIMDEHTFFFQIMCQLRRGLVVTSNNQLFVEEISCDSAHAYTASSYEIYCFNIFQFHYFLANFTTSSAMTSAEFFKPNFLIFSLSEFNF